MLKGNLVDYFIIPAYLPPNIASATVRLFCSGREGRWGSSTVLIVMIDMSLSDKAL